MKLTCCGDGKQIKCIFVFCPPLQLPSCSPFLCKPERKSADYRRLQRIGPSWVLIWNINIWSWESFSIWFWHYKLVLCSFYCNLCTKLKDSRAPSLIVQYWSSFNNAVSDGNEISKHFDQNQHCVLFLTLLFAAIWICPLGPHPLLKHLICSEREQELKELWQPIDRDMGSCHWSPL